MVSIVIPTCNRPLLLAKCLDALHPSIQKVDSDYEVIVSDDSHNDETKLLLDKEYDWVKWVKGSRNGPAGNRNRGFSFSRYEWIMFIDDDCIPSPNIIRNYINATRDYPNILVFEGKIEEERPKVRFDESAPINVRGGYLWTCNMLIYKTLFLKLGCFDERLGMSMEDIAFRETLKTLKIKFKFVPNASVVHPWKKETVKWIIKDSKNKYYSTLQYKKLYPKISQKITPKHYIKSTIYRIYYSLFKLIPYRFKGFHILLVQSYMDIIHAIKLSREFKK